MFKKSLLIMLLMVLLAPWAVMGQGTVYSKITENKTDWSGTYVFANTTKSVGANTTLSSGRLGAVSIDIDATGNTITDKKSAAVYEITKSGNIYYITTTIDNTTYYLRKYKSGSSYQLRLETSNEATSYYQWSISYNETNNNVVFTNTGNNVTHYLICYAGSSPDFEINTMVNSSSYKGIDLYEEITITGCPIPSVTASSVGGRTATINWTYLGTDTYTDFEYICSETSITDFTGLTGTAVTGTSKELTGLTPETPYFCYVRTVCDATNDEYSDWSNACTFTTLEACPVPTGLTCTAYTATTATLEWTSTGAESYEIYLTTDENDMPTSSSTTEIISSTNTKTLEELTPDTYTYYAYVRSNCGTSDGKSDWSAVCSFMPSAAVDITVYNKTNTNNSIPFHSTYADYGTRAQFVIPASALQGEGMESGAIIQKLTFHTSTTSTSYNQEFTVYLKEVSYTTFATATLEDWSSMTAVWTNTLTISDNQLVIDFSTSPYTYHGGNLMIGFQVTSWGSTSPSVYWYGENQSSGTYTAAYNDANSSHVWSSTISRQTFIPKTTINYIPGVEDPCHAPKDLNAENITASSADLSWTKSDLTTTCTLRYRAKIDGQWGEWITKNDVADPYISYTLSGLNANTQYEYQVMGACGEGDTDWSSSYVFTTDCGTVEITTSTPFPTEGFENSTLPTCWNGGWKTSTNNHHSGSRAAWSDNEANVVMYMPTIHINADAATLKFWSYTYYPTNYGKNSVLVSTDDGESFTEIWTPETVSASWSEIKVDMPTNYLNIDIIIAFKYEYNTEVYEYSRHQWYIDDITINAYKTYNMNVTGYGSNAGGYRLIATPVLEVTPTAANGFLTEDFDLYMFDESQNTNEWLNYEQLTGITQPFSKLVSGKGYLYASKTNTELAFTGTPYNGDGVVTLQKTEGANLSGWNLVGNPFGVTAYPSKEKFYVLMDTDEGSKLVVSESNSVAAMEGIFVIATENDETMTFSTEAPANINSKKLLLNVKKAKTRSNSILDRAIVSFNDGSQLPKFQINENTTEVYFTQGGKDYAVVSSEAQGEMPVNFKAKENGSYTISIETEDLDLNYLHLIDNLTGADVDLLANPNYTFEAATTDYASRFRLMFNATGIEESASSSETFAYYNNGNIVVNNEGQATLYVMDITGRIIATQDCNEGLNTVSTNDMVPGIYMLRLVNGENVKVQKIVVR